jgi:hypothetical protein
LRLAHFFGASAQFWLNLHRPPEEREIHQDAANSKTLRTGPRVSPGFAPGSRVTTPMISMHRASKPQIS